jgi:hypothetical protein
VIPALETLPVSRIVSAAGAVVMTSIILLAIGLGFPTPAAAQAVQRPASAPIVSDTAVERGRYAVSNSRPPHLSYTHPANATLTALPVKQGRLR